MAYLYNFIGKPEKTKEKVHYILNNFYKNSPDGLIGNEDCGQMSAWYVLSALGIYAVTPGIPEWTQTQPLFSSATIQMEDGSRVALTPETPKSRLGIATVPTNTQANFLTAPKIVPVPVIEAAHKAFKDQMQVTITAQHSSHRIFYLVTVKGADYSRVKRTFVPYVGPFTIDATSTVSAYVMEGKQTSQTIFAVFFKKPNNYSIAITSTYNPQYHAGGPEGLLDGIHGTTNWRKGDWQGYQAQDFEAVVDLKETKSISTCKTFCLQDTRSWIVMPTQVAYYSSLDGVDFTLLGTLTHTVDPQDYENSIHDFALQLPKSIQARYIKVKAINYGKLPEWHIGAGGDAFIFVDEIEIN
jgi:hypothetical protein